jgi:hypothetical protein
MVLGRRKVLGSFGMMCLPIADSCTCPLPAAHYWCFLTETTMSVSYFSILFVGSQFPLLYQFVAQRIFDINEGKNFKDPAILTDDERETQDDEIFHRSRLVNCGYFMQIILGGECICLKFF